MQTPIRVRRKPSRPAREARVAEEGEPAGICCPTSRKSSAETFSLRKHARLLPSAAEGERLAGQAGATRECTRVHHRVGVGISVASRREFWQSQASRIASDEREHLAQVLPAGSSASVGHSNGEVIRRSRSAKGVQRVIQLRHDCASRPSHFRRNSKGASSGGGTGAACLVGTMPFQLRRKSLQVGPGQSQRPPR